MTGHLYVLGIGPVQDFIAAARRTRDLWFGSFMLSEISKAAAKEIAESGGKLIFPALEKGNPDLEPATSPDTYNVSNIILAELPAGIDPTTTDKRAQTAATGRWQKFAHIARQKAERIIDTEIWDAQILDVLEYNSAWIEVEDFNREYAAKRQKLMRIFSGRKALRNFSQNQIERPGVHKSSLDGARESVIRPNSKFPRDLQYQIRATEGELLCAVGMVKRLSGIDEKPVSFPSISRVCLDSWIRNVVQHKEDSKAMLQRVRERCTGNWSFVSGIGQDFKEFYKDFPFDGQVLFPNRLRELIRTFALEQKKDPHNETITRELAQLREIRKCISYDGIRKPDPYVAMLIADGDRMGAALSSMDNPEKHRAFSRKLAEFSAKAKEIVNKDRHGCLIYSGGDDVMALLPVDTCLQAARDLHDEFSRISDGIDLAGCPQPTLSVGIVICHSLTPLEDIRAYAKRAEEHAKSPDRNGLAVHVYKRGGGDPILVREQWNGPESRTRGLDERLARYARLYTQERIPDKAAYDIKQISDIYNPGLNRTHIPGDGRAASGNRSGIMDPVYLDFIKAELLYILKKKRQQRGRQEMETEDISDLVSQVTDVPSLSRLADELILARKIADHLSDIHGGENT